MISQSWPSKLTLLIWLVVKLVLQSFSQALKISVTSAFKLETWDQFFRKKNKSTISGFSERKLFQLFFALFCFVWRPALMGELCTNFRPRFNWVETVEAAMFDNFGAATFGQHALRSFPWSCSVCCAIWIHRKQIETIFLCLVFYCKEDPNKNSSV